MRYPGAVHIIIVVACCAMTGGCKKSGETPSAPSEDQGASKVIMQDMDDGTHQEALEEIKLEDLPTLLERDAIDLPHAVYEVMYRGTEDGTTRAWVELNDLRDSDYDALLANTAQFGDGQVIVPPGSPGIPKKHAAYKAYSIVGNDTEGAFSARPVGFTYYKGPSEEHVISVAVPERKLREDAYYLAVVGEHDELTFAQPTKVDIESAVDAKALEKVHGYLKKTLRPKELEALPGVLTPGDLEIFGGAWLRDRYAYLAVLDVVLDSSDKAADHISAMLLLDKDYNVKGLIEAPAKRPDTFHVKGLLKVKAADPGYLIYENLQYEGAYTYLFKVDEQGKTSLIMLGGDGL